MPYIVEWYVRQSGRNLLERAGAKPMSRVMQTVPINKADGPSTGAVLPARATKEIPQQQVKQTPPPPQR